MFDFPARVRSTSQELALKLIDSAVDQARQPDEKVVDFILNELPTTRALEGVS